MDNLEARLQSASGSRELPQMLCDSFQPSHRLSNGDPVDELSYSAYLEYYEYQWNLTARNCDGKFVALKTSQLMNWLVQELQTDKQHADLLAEICDKSEEGTLEEACENSLSLAARLLLMMRIGPVKYQFSPRRCLVWRDGSLRQFLNEYFDSGHNPILSVDGIKLPKAFNGWSLEQIGGIEISFTDNLADHLLLTEDDSKVFIFHHVCFLELQRLKGADSLFPPGFAQETLQTLALLFPQSMVNGPAGSRAPRKRWFRNLCARGSICNVRFDERLGRCGNLHAEDRRIETFRFWRDRLVILKQAYDDANPRTLSQFWHDRRNGVQWYTFWVAIMVLLLSIIFGVVQCIEGGYQVWKA